MFRNIFGEKSWYESLTAWGTVVWVAGTAALVALCDVQLLSSGACDTAQAWIDKIGPAMIALGLRRASN